MSKRAHHPLSPILSSLSTVAAKRNIVRARKITPRITPSKTPKKELPIERIAKNKSPCNSRTGRAKTAYTALPIPGLFARVDRVVDCFDLSVFGALDSPLDVDFCFLGDVPELLTGFPDFPQDFTLKTFDKGVQP